MRFLLPVLCLLVLAACGQDSDPPAGKQAAKDGRKMNISCFVYRDVNRNGVYDMADRPYSGLPVILTDDSGKTVRKQSNLAGFANFAMSSGDTQHPISRSGRYRVEARPHQDWEITSANADQVLEIVALDGSPGGLVAAATLGQVGVAPIPRVTGNLPAAGGEWLLRPMGDPEGQLIPLEDDGDGRFDQAVGTGEWEILTRDGSALSPRGKFTMAGETVYLPDISRPFTVSEVTQARLDFDGLTSSDTLYEVPSGYGGLDWHNWIATHHKFYSGFGYINATTSGEYSAYNSSGHPAEFSSSKPFHVRSVNLGVAWRQAESADIHVRAWRGDELLHHDRLRASTKGAIRLLVNYMNVTRVEISTDTYWQAVIDDLVVAIP